MDVEEVNETTIIQDVEGEQSRILDTHENQDFANEEGMLPSFPKQFQNREHLLNYVKNLSFTQGYATSIKDSKKDKYVRIGCDRGGVYRNRVNVPLEDRKTKTSSRLVNCPFELRGNKQLDGIWVLRVQNGEHNHVLSNEMSGHPSFRRLSEEEYKRVKHMTMAGIPPRHMITSLRQTNPNLLAVSQTVYAAKAKIRKEYLRGRTPIQSLLEGFSQGGFVHNVKHDEENRLTHLFFAHPLSIKLRKNYSNVFVMDCTYKTNKFGMPLLDIIGVTSFNTSFYSCCVFLRKKEEGDYIWALTMFKKMLGDTLQPTVFVTDRELALMNALQVVFPTTTHLLCVWHIEKNILTKCKPHFEEGDEWTGFISHWTEVVQSPTETTYNDAWKELETLYGTKTIVIKYIKSTWLPHKTCFVRAWTDKHVHCRNHASSRAEGAHATLKKYLEVWTGNLHEVTRKICLAIENNFLEVKTQLASEKISVPHNICIPYFKELHHCVSVFALNKLFKQYQTASKGTLSPICKGNFYASVGLPCAHMMRNMNSEMRLSDIHSQWRLDGRTFDVQPITEEDQVKPLLEEIENKYRQWPIVQKEAALKQLSQLVSMPNPIIYDPVIQSHKGRPLGSKSKKTISATTRHPSAFEIVESSRKCRVCRGVGHNIRTCPHDTGGATSDSYIGLSNQVDIDLNSLPDDMDNIF